MSVKDCVTKAIREFEALWGLQPTRIDMSYTVFYDLVHEPGGKNLLTVNDTAEVEGVLVVPSLYPPGLNADFIISCPSNNLFGRSVTFPDMSADAAEIYLTLRADGMSPLTAKAAAERLAA